MQESGSRKGVPQFQMPHALLKRGLNVAEELFPGFRNDLIAHGAQPVDFLRDVCMVGQTEACIVACALHPAGSISRVQSW